MCGIAGIFETHPQNDGALAAMLRQMIARGPDDEGTADVVPGYVDVDVTRDAAD